MYWSVYAVAKGLNPIGLLLWPRPLYFETLFWAGHLGLVAALCALDALLLLDLALAIFLAERFILRRTIPWPIVLGALLWAMSGPGFYKQPGNDVGFHLALLFALLGVWIWESQSQKRAVAALCAAGVCFALSVLAKESLIPGIVFYSAICAFRYRRTLGLAAALAALPLIAIVVSLADSQLAHSPFVKMASSGVSYPYKIDLSPASMWFCLRYYTGALANAGFLLLFAAIGYALWLQGRLKIGALLALAALALYIPYTVLPNHFDTTYQWVAMPLLMLLFPLAWVGVAGGLALRAALALALVSALVFQRTQFVEDKHWNAVALAQNRSVLSALRAHQRQISGAHSVLVTGLTFGRWPFMQSATFLSKDLQFAGEWTVTTEPGFAPIELQSEARPIDYDHVKWRDYDLVLMFDRDGVLVAPYTREQLQAELARRGLVRLSNRGIVDLLQFHYPPGVTPPVSWAASARDGLYLEEDSSQCCFLNGKPTFTLDKPAGAKAVVFTFDVPHTLPFTSVSERVEVYFDGRLASPAIALTAGVHRTIVAIPPLLRKSPHLTVTLHMSIAYVPKALGMNDDQRSLSIKLRRVDYVSR
jgi:hypothetical protein